MKDELFYENKESFEDSDSYNNKENVTTDSIRIINN